MQLSGYYKCGIVEWSMRILLKDRRKSCSQGNNQIRASIVMILVSCLDYLERVTDYYTSEAMHLIPEILPIYVTVWFLLIIINKFLLRINKEHSITCKY